MVDYFPQGPPAAADASSNEFDGYPDDVTRIAAYPKPASTPLDLGHPPNVVAAADRYGKTTDANRSYRRRS